MAKDFPEDRRSLAPLWIEAGGRLWKIGGTEGLVCCDHCGMNFVPPEPHLCEIPPPRTSTVSADEPIEAPKPARTPKPVDSVNGLILNWRRASA